MCNEQTIQQTDFANQLITKQAAIDWLTNEWDGMVTSVFDGIKNLPSAQPIDIQDILEYLDTVLHPIVSPEHWDIYSELYDMISALPSAQPRIKGRWTEKTVTENPQACGIREWQSAKCSVCGKYHSTPYLYSFTEYAFCPWCGAEMRQQEEQG